MKLIKGINRSTPISPTWPLMFKNVYSLGGYDIDEKYIDLGLTKFPELKNKFKIGNCENIKLKVTDCSIFSAVLETSDNPKKILNNVLKSTKKVVCIRTYLGNNIHYARMSKDRGLLKPFNMNQFSFKMIEKILQKNNFNVFYILDKASNNSQKPKLVNNIHKRNMFIVLGIKN